MAAEASCFWRIVSAHGANCIHNPVNCDVTKGLGDQRSEGGCVPLSTNGR